MAVDVGNDYDFSDDDFDPSTISKVNVHKMFQRAKSCFFNRVSPTEKLRCVKTFSCLNLFHALCIYIKNYLHLSFTLL